MNKRNLVLQTAIAGLFASSGAFAAVDISVSPVVPVKFAQEIIATSAAPVTLTNAGTNLDLSTNIGYSLSTGEVRYVRMELTNGAKFNAASAVTASDAVNCTVGAINGLGTSVIYFSLTGAAAGCTNTDTLTVTGNRTVIGNSDVNASYSLYDLPSQAQAGGATGRIVNDADNAYIDFTASYTAAVTTDSAIADVEADTGAFKKFDDTPDDTTATTTEARIAAVDYKLAGTVYKADGAAIALADLMATGATGTKLVITGDFSAAQNTADGTYTGAALNRVFLSASTTCASVDVAASSVSATGASFNVGATATTANPSLCYKPNGTNQIAASSYTGLLDAVSASAAIYNTADIDLGTIGSITRNGTELQSPWFSTAAGYTSRFVLTNTGTTAAAYSTSCKVETGNTATAGSGATGTIAAGKQLVLSATDICTFSGNTRGAVVFTISAPNSNIQGVYNIVNATTGSISVSNMMRPGTN